MKILGLWDGHDASASVMVDGELVAALCEERLSRRKMQRGFPTQAIGAVLEAAGLSPSDLDAVAVAGRGGRLLMRLFNRNLGGRRPGHGPMDLLPRAMRHYENITPTVPGWRTVESALSCRCLRERLREQGIPASVPLLTVPHHAAHAFGAASLLPDGAGLVWTMDGYGDGLWATATRWVDGQPKLLSRHSYRSSPAVTYGAVSQLLGFGEGEEGKVTALAALGDASATADFFRQGPMARGGPLRPGDVRHLKGYAPIDIAAGVQRALEEAGLGLIGSSLTSSDRALAVAGGLFANVTVNRRLIERFPSRSIHVFPAMGDGGLSAGAAFYVQARHAVPPRPWKDAYLGPPLVRRLEPARLPPGTRMDRERVPELKVARMLAAGAVVAMVDGRDEFGPRALGNRSLLFAATDPSVADRVQAALGRDTIMPFAPVCRARHVESLFSPPYPCAERADYGLSFMTIAIKARAETARRYPVAVHADDTARVQAVTRGRHRYLYRILAEYEKLTGNLLLINTSFNLHGEPIVHDLDDALRTFLIAGCDGLLIGRRLLTSEAWAS